MKIRFNVLDRQFLKDQTDYEEKALEVLRSGWYILGNEVSEFEKEFACFMGTNHCVGLASGLDALYLSFKILGMGEGDEVLVPANTYIASIMGVTQNFATPVLVEPDEFYNINSSLIEQKITSRTKAILPVHLYGQACNMEKIRAIASRYNLYVVEDCAQSHGAQYNGKFTSTYADISCYSFYPSKNLGGFGDGGAITTDNNELAQKFRIYRNYGSEKRYHNMVVGVNSRLDEMQAGLLRVKLKKLNALNQERADLARSYLQGIHNPKIKLPKVAPNATSVWHLFVVTTNERNRLAEYLFSHGVETLIHYPIPPHLSQAYSDWNITAGSLPVTEQYCRTILSLPLYIGMTFEEQPYVIDVINQFS